MSQKDEKKPVSPQSWWRNFDLSPGFSRQLQIGPARLLVSHLEREWRVTFASLDESSGINVGEQLSMPPPVPASAAAIDGGVFARYASHRTMAGFRLVPCLADRPVVCKPMNPLFVLPGDQVGLFVSTPVWIKVLVNSEGEDDGVAVCDVPAIAMTDTWIGSSPVEGEIGYSTRTKARLSFADVPVRPHLVSTGVVVRNLSQEPLHLERLSLPAPLLGVFVTPDQALCTEGIILEHRESRQMARLEIMREPMGPESGCKRISGPRQIADGHATVVRAFGSLLTHLTGSLT